MTVSDCDQSETSHARPRLAGMWCVSLAAFSLLYLATCQRGVSWQDSGAYQWRMLQGDLFGDDGLARAHPLLICAGQVVKDVPAGTVGWRLNALSALAMAVALANLTAALALVTGRWWVGLLTTSILGVTHTIWWLATITESYPLSVAGLTAELWLLILLMRRPSWQTLAGLGLVNGLGVCVHNFALLPLPVYATVAVVLTARRRLPLPSLAVAAVAWLLGAGLYIGLIVQEAWGPAGPGAAVHSALFGNYAAQVMNVTRVSTNLEANLALTGINFISVLTPLAVIGWITMRRRLGGAIMAALTAVTVIEVLFFARYPVPDQFTFVLPTLVMLALAAGVGLSSLADASPQWRRAAIAACAVSIVGQPILYALAPSALRAAGVKISRRRKLPFRDEGRYWLMPWKHNEDSAGRFATAALQQAGPDGVVLADSTATPPLLIVRRDNPGLQGVAVQCQGSPLGDYDRDPRVFRAILGARRLYVVSPEQEGLSRQLLADTEPLGRPADEPVLYHLKWKSP